ncbi:MAG: SH3 domain-containing protein [Woeseia sp.]
MKQPIVTLLLSCVLLAACGHTPNVNTNFDTDVIGIEEQHLSTDFWLAKLKRPDAVLMDQAAILDFNKAAFNNDPTMVSLADYPQQLAGSTVAELITSISKPSSYDRFLPDGRALDANDYNRYLAALNLDAIPSTVRPAFGLIVARTNMRTFPTRDKVISAESSFDLDRFQEHALFPGEAVAVLHSSADGQWLFVQSYNYAAWIEKDRVATGERQRVIDFVAADNFLLVTGSKVYTNYNPHLPATSEVQLDMGVRLPLMSASEVGHNLHGQNPSASYVVRLPVRNDDGTLRIEPTLIGRGQDVRKGFLPYTHGNILRQAFKFLGERYGWGHDYNGRDCTGFVSEIYKSFGILMPRNSGDQGRSVAGDNVRLDDATTAAEKMPAVDALRPGAMLYLPGHVAMYIGDDRGQPYMIHDVAGLSYFDDNGQLYRGLLHGVSVTPLLPMQLSEETRYLDRIYNIKTIH